MRLQASDLSSLLNLLYILVIDYLDNGTGKATKDIVEQLRMYVNDARKWDKELPGLIKALNSSISGKDKLKNLVLLGYSIKENFDKLKNNEQFRFVELDALKAAGAFLRTDSEPAKIKLIKLASLTGSIWVTQHLKAEEVDQSSVKEQLVNLVQKLIGRKAYALTLDESKLIRETKPVQYKEYLALRKIFNQSWKDSIVNYIRNSGQKLVPYKDVLDYLDSNGISYSLPKGFVGYIDDTLTLYTQKSKEKIEGFPSAINFPKIRMNKEFPQEGWVFQAIRPNGEDGPYFYTVNFKKEQSRKKFEKVKILTDKIPHARKLWLANVKNFELDPLHVGCLILELLYQTAARVGTPGNKTYGLATLLVKHVKIQPNGIYISYKGKDSVLNKHLILNVPENKYTIKALEELIEGKDPKDRVFQVGKNYVGPAYVNKLFKQLTGMPQITVHKIRTMRGTKLFTELMNEIMPKLLKKKLTDKEALIIFNKLAEKVGKLLNHVKRGATGQKITGTTAVANYIDFSVSREFFRQLGLRPPKALEVKE